MFRVGLTGGIGSGKSTAARVFELLGIPVYYADKEAKVLMNSNSDLINAISKRFGKGVIFKDSLNRKALAEIVFKDDNALMDLNNIVHPAVRKDFNNWVSLQKSPYIIEEAAILFETGFYMDFDYVISVLAPIEKRVDRLLMRDATTVNKIQDRMKTQVDDAIRKEKSDYLLNNGKDDLLLPQITKIHKDLIEKNKNLEGIC